MTICSYNNSGQIKYDVDIEMAQGYWNTSASRLWTKIRDNFHDELVAMYAKMRANGLSYESLMSYFYGQQISKIPETYYNKDADTKYLPFATQYMGMAHGNGYEHLKRWLKNRLIFTDTLYDYAPSYNNDVLTIRANTTEPMTITIETYTPVYQHLSWYNNQMDKKKIDGKIAVTFTGTAQAATDQEVLIYGGSNIKRITGISSMNPNSMLIGSATRLIELDVSNCPILATVNATGSNFTPHTYLNKLDISNCPKLTGTLRINNSPLLRELNAKGTGIDTLQLAPSLRNLEVLRLPNTVTELTLNDAGLLNTLEFDEGGNLQRISLSNCPGIANSNIDLTKVPTVSLDNSLDKEELYLSEVTDLTLKNMPTLKRLLFTPNNEYEEFNINNVINGKNYKVTTFNNPNMKEFITTAPHRVSYHNGEYGDITPNTTFSANTLDLSDTQFTDIKFLCTTDLYNLKVPTTMKNFYCDSAMDIDTEVVTDGSYEFTHDELVEQYTTNYEGEVYRHITQIQTIKDWDSGQMDANGNITNSTTYFVSDFISPIGDFTITPKGVNYFCLNWYNEKKEYIGNKYAGDWSNEISYSLAYGGSSCKYFRICSNTENLSLKLTTCVTPNIIPSSASGSLIFNLYSNNTTQPTSTSPYMWDLTGLKLNDFYTFGMNNWVKKDTSGNITMPQRLPGYSIRMVNADITPNNYANHLYPLLVDTTLPITGKLDYSKYKGTSLAWAYAYTTNDVAITPLGSQQQGNITNDYNKLYSTDYVDIVDVWAYKDDDFSNKSTNEAITKAYIELTSSNYTTRIDEVLQWYPNCTDLYLFEDGSVTSLVDMYNNKNNQTTVSQVQNVIFIDGYFNNLTNMKNCFREMKQLVTVSNIPDNVTSLTGCFLSCYLLESVDNLPESIVDLSNTFTGCYKLTTAPTIPEGVTNMSGTFQSCSLLTTVPNIPNSVTNMDSTFRGCLSLTTAPTIPSKVTSMSNTFYDCSKLTTAPTIPNSVTNIQATFANCSSLTTVPNLPNSIGNMNGTFQGCSSLTTVPNIPSSITAMIGTFSGCSSLTTAPNIPNSVTNIYNTFNGCSKLTECTIPLTNLTSYSNCLQNCSSLTNITWSGERTTDFSLATLNAPSYTEADIQELVPEHLGTVESATLDLGGYGSSLEPADVFGANQKGWTIVGANMDFMIINKDFDVSSMVDDDSVTSCFIELTNSNKSSRIDSVLNHLPNCTSINLYEDGTVTTLSNLISRKTSSSKITEVSFVEGNFNNVTNMEYAFQDCTSLTKVNNIPKSVTSLECTFKGCSKLVTSPPIHDGVTNMYYTFWECISLVNAPDIPNTVTDIYGCFRSCWKLKTGPLTMPDEVETISYLFKDCRVLETVPALPKRCVGGNMISPSAIETFLDCKKLTTVPPSMPDGIIDVTSCFQGATKLVNAPTFPDTVVIMKSAFMYDTSIQNVVVPPNVYNYWNVCFGCSALREVTLPLGALTSSSDTKFSDALYNCGNITNITWTGTLSVNYSLSTLCATSYTSQDVKELVNEHLGTVESATLTLGEAYLAYLTEEEIASAVSKGWTLQ